MPKTQLKNEVNKPILFDHEPSTRLINWFKTQ